MVPFRAISVFYQVATLNSVAAAAEHLGVTPSAVTQQLRALEQQIGTSLVTKVGRKIRLTEAGERYFEMIAEQVEGIIASTQLIQGAKPSTLLTIRATPTISTKWLLPRLPAFLDANPDIDIRLDGTNEPTDFARDLVDVEIRHGTGKWTGLHIEPLVEERFVPVCAPSLAGQGALQVGDLTGFRLIHSVKAQVQWNTLFQKAGIADQGVMKRLYFDRSHMAVDAAVLGLGVALESTLMMERELQTGQLVVPLRDVPEMRVTTQWLVCPHANLRRRRVKRFLDWVRDQARDWQRIGMNA
ncbi:LysR substrate-binding domain-containing protein [Pseudotabrizicola alkalilacus]|uniref:LysR family transcriptional regulator n=1 Tax=Pseudotabrizicola alkalilacus TaxID=2305252 RepID=A0A411YW98_9RHOB|nr:LysR substrate-binding domain-containing protein [Pseudotabrizicola alkalilacus]RGP35164.1 LysR family transcriptional regulator [Pseudotabrizicola alkalilacus]